jgi:hypothetical protein
MWQALQKFLLGGVGEEVAEYFKDRQRLKQELKKTKLQGEIDIAKAKAEAKIAQQKHIQTWEQTYVNMQRESLKDEIVLGVVLSPYIGAFIPGVQDHVLVGFQYLAEMPYWAVGLTVTIMLAIYGIRHRNASKINAPGLRESDVTTKETS